MQKKNNSHQFHVRLIFLRGLIPSQEQLMVPFEWKSREEMYVWFKANTSKLIIVVGCAHEDEWDT